MPRWRMPLGVLSARWPASGAAAPKRGGGALQDRPCPGAAPLVDRKGEAFLVALACTDPPAGKRAWTMQLLAERLVALDRVDHISEETVRRTLKKR
jgi:hypothetical protein